MWASLQITGKVRHSCQWDSATGRVLIEPHFLQQDRDSLGSQGQGAWTLPSDHPPSPRFSAPQRAEPVPTLSFVGRRCCAPNCSLTGLRVSIISGQVSFLTVPGHLSRQPRTCFLQNKTKVGNVLPQ